MNLKVTFVQSPLHWEDVDENLSQFSKKLDDITNQTDVVVLPEMFNTGFSMESKKLAESMNGKTVNWMKLKAEENDVAIVGSLIIEESNNYYNRLVWMNPDGTHQTYDKKHLFRMAGEHEHFNAGEQRIIVEYKGWKICPLVCYDLRFPVWARNQNQEYDCLIYIANWPAPRVTHWSKLLEARAIENQSYVVGVNRIGKDEKENNYSGYSVVIDPKGNQISNTLPNTESIETIELSMATLTTYREKFPVGLDADGFDLN